MFFWILKKNNAVLCFTANREIVPLSFQKLVREPYRFTDSYEVLALEIPSKNVKETFPQHKHQHINNYTHY